MPKVSVLRVAVVLIATLAICGGSAWAQSDFEKAISQYSDAQVKGYIQPFADIFGANLNTGFAHSAAIPTVGFHMEFSLIVMGGAIGDDQKTYDLPLPVGFSASTMKAPTIFGPGEGASYQDPASGLTYLASGGVFGASMLPALTPQLTIGSLYGTEALIRFLATPKIQDMDADMLALGVRHNVSQWFGVLPVDIAGGFYYTKLRVADLIEYSSVAVSAMASKEFEVVTVYGGLQWEQGTMDLKYEQSDPTKTKVSVSLDAANTIRGTLGAGLTLGVFRLFADANFGSVMTFSGGIGFGI